MSITSLYGCAATYLYQIPRQNNVTLSKTPRKVEASAPSYTGKRFNQNAGTKANHTHVDICI